MNRTRKVLIGLVATSTLAVPLSTLGTSEAAPRPRPVVKVLPINDAWTGRAAAAFSPNGDHVKDKGRVAFRLARKSQVTVKVRRTNKVRTVVYRKKLGKLTRGKHIWAWNGKNFRRKVVRDGRYSVVFVVHQVADDGKKGRAGGEVHVDTKFDAKWKPAFNADGSDTVYPRTLVTQDWIGLTLGNSDADPMTALGGFVTTLRDPQGDVVHKDRSRAYHADEYGQTLRLGFSGRTPRKQPLPAGAYTLRYKVWDLAGNPGGAKSLTVHVSDKILVEARGTLVVPPTAAATARTQGASARDGRPSKDVGQNEPPRIPCGTVVASEVYTDPGARSWRSSEACGDDWFRPAIATATGGVDIAAIVPQEASPRGVQLATFSMRGKPAVDGETDVARLSPTHGYHPGGSSVTSAPVAGETVTTTPQVRYEWEPVYSGTYTWKLGWTIQTTGSDWFDVADVTVTYHYLTPRAG